MTSELWRPFVGPARAVLPYLPAREQIRDLGYLLGGNLLKIALGFATSIIIFRALGPGDSGRLALALGIIGLFSIVGEFGLRDAAVTYIARFMPAIPDRAHAVSRTFLVAKVCLTGFASALAFFASAFIAERFYPDADVESLIKLGAFSLFTGGVLSFSLVILEARQKFGAISYLGIVQAVIRAVLIVILFVVRGVNVYSLLVVEAIVPFAVFIYSLRFIPRPFFVLRRPLVPDLGTLFHFTKWIAVAAVASAIFLKLDVLMLSYYRPTTEVGLYAVALALVSRLDILKSAILTTAFPDASRRSELSDLRGFVHQSLKLTAIASIALLPLFVVGGFLIQLLYGTAYQDAVPAFYLLLLGFIIGLNSAPVAFVLYPLNQPRWIAVSDLIQLGFNAVLFLILIPPFGMIGAAIAVVLTRVLAAIITFILVRRMLWVPLVNDS